MLCGRGFAPRISKLPSNARRAFLRPANHRPLNGLTPSRIIGVALPVTIASTYFDTAHICRILSLSTSPALRTPYQAAALYHIVRVPYGFSCPNGLPDTDRVGAFCKRAGERSAAAKGITSLKMNSAKIQRRHIKKSPNQQDRFMQSCGSGSKAQAQSIFRNCSRRQCRQ